MLFGLLWWMIRVVFDNLNVGCVFIVHLLAHCFSCPFVKQLVEEVNISDLWNYRHTLYAFHLHYWTSRSLLTENTAASKTKPNSFLWRKKYGRNWERGEKDESVVRICRHPTTTKKKIFRWLLPWTKKIGQKLRGWREGRECGEDLPASDDDEEEDPPVMRCSCKNP